MENTKTSVIEQSEIERQRQISLKLKEELPKYFSHQPRAFVHSYGCQQNVSDSERMKGMLDEMGFEFVDDPQAADLILYNTCAVREHAEDRVYGNVGMLKQKKLMQPETIIALCGCMVQQEHVAEKIKKSYPYVSIVFGTHVIHTLPEMIFNYISRKKRLFNRPENNGVIAENISVRRDSRFKGWLPIMYGCNNFCTYCIVPYVRGRERSRKPEDIINEAKQMIKEGFKDITLLGQNVNSYGKSENYDINFAKLLRELNDIEGDFQLRFMTSHPKDCTEELLLAMAECEKVCKHLHLPFQSGNNRILKEMNRHYTREHYLSLINKAKELMPDISLTSDIIVGFPGETYEEFKDTLSLIKEVEFTSLFTFIYSKRRGTPAEKMEDNVTHEEKAKWLQELLDAQEIIAAKRTASYVGKTFKVLCEEYHDDGKVFGRTPTNIGITFAGDKSCIGQFKNVKITKALNWVLEGEIIGG